MMGYANPLVAYGTDQFVRDAREAGADGLIVPGFAAGGSGDVRGELRARGTGAGFLPGADQQ